MWATPDTDGTYTLLTGSKAAQHIAASRSDAQPANEMEIFELHPLLYVIPQYNMDEGMAEFVTNFNQPYNHKGNSIDCVLRPLNRDTLGPLHHPSIYRMYISQPTVKEVSVDIEGRDNGDPFRWNWTVVATVTIRHEEGITFGHLLHEIKTGMPRTSRWPHFHRMYFSGGIAMTAYVKNIIETASELTGRITSETDPFKSKDDEGYDSVDFDYIKYRPWEEVPYRWKDVDEAADRSLGI